MLVLRSRRVVLPEGQRAAALHIENGVIERIVEYQSDDPTGARLFNAGNDVVSPGIVDTHVHVNEPGRTEWEGFDTATRSAAAGGVTTIVDMPLNSVPATTTARALRAKRDTAQSQCHIDVAFWGGVVPANTSELDGLVDAGARGFKCFLAPSGVDEFPAVDEHDLRAALPILARRGVPLLVHAELPEYLVEPADPDHATNYATYLATRPPAAELEAIRLMIRLAEEFKTRVHIVHVSSAESVAAIAAAKAAWVPITAETCPHYLTFSAEEIPDEATEFKCAPPIRDASHRDALWDGLDSGALDMIATDHSPCLPTLKRPGGVGDFIKAWGGISSLQLTLPATYTALSAQRSKMGEADSESSPLSWLARWMSAVPAALAGLGTRKGQIAPGFDADLVVWNPDLTFVVDPLQLRHRHKLTPYTGRTLAGTVLTTFVRGERVWDKNRLARAYRRAAAMKGSFADLVDLASERLGAAAVAANDEFFAPKERLLLASAPVWREGEYTERGKWMDGWETRRRRDLEEGSHDWCIVRLGAAGIVRGVDVDTAFFKGNYPATFALDVCELPGLPPPDALAHASWLELLPRTALSGDSHNLVAVDAPTAVTHVRLRIFPDGGVARLRVYGDVVADWGRLLRRGDVDLAAAEHGGVVVACSDMFFGSRHNLIMPGDATHMGDGWETKRRRGRGHDWTVIRLGHLGAIRRVEIDTRHFKGNAPGACSLEGCAGDEAHLLSQPVDDPGSWRELLPRTPLQPHARHAFEDELRSIGDVTHVRFNIFPDGGVGRLRLFGRVK